MKRLIFILIAAAAACAAWAEVMETITLRNGNTYKGLLWMQLSDGEIGFKADTSIVYLPAKEIDRIVKLPAAKKGDKRVLADIYLVSQPDTVAVVEEPVAVVADSVAVIDSVAVSTDIVPAVEGYFEDDTVIAVGDDDIIRGVELLEEGSIVKYLDSTPRDLKLRMKDIRLISRVPRDPALLNGLLDEIVTKSGETYTGYIVTTEPGKSVRINDDGRVYSVLVSDIGIMRRVAVDRDEPVFIQAPVLDNVYLGKDGGVLLDVVLVEQNYGKGTFDVIDRDNVVTRRPLADITKIRKAYNRDYRPRREFAFDADSLYINRQAVTEIPFERKSGKIKLKAANLATVPSFARTGGCISVETTDSQTARRSVLMALGAKLPSEISLDIADMLEKNIPVHSQEINDRTNILKRDYSVAPGFYALINTESSTLVIFRVR